jgi:N-acetylglucosaminyldiphosphoundecaprenol N-acetyl-beta-D-mannosaminyltransferase
VTLRRVALMGYRLADGDAPACVADVASWVTGGDRARWLACLNPHSFVVARGRPDFASALAEADWLVADGAGITLAARILGSPLRARVTGSDVLLGLSRYLDGRGGARVFFLGTTDATLAAVRERYQREFPNLRVVGCHAPPYRAAFSEAELDAMVRAVNAARPDVLWVGLGAPKQELWLRQVAPRLDVRFAAAVGAAFDYYAGRVRRAHPVFQRAGLEWLPRFFQEPRRLWRRVMLSTPVFLWHVARAWARRRPDPDGAA